MKKRYEELEMEVIRFGSSNIITDSNGETPHEGEGEDKFEGTENDF